MTVRTEVFISKSHGVRILETIPAGLPFAMVPRASVLAQVFPMAVLVALIMYVLPTIIYHMVIVVVN